MVSQKDSTFVWKYSPVSSSSPCYIFPNPASPSEGSHLPLGCFVPRPRLQDPGFLLASPSGSIRYWTSISLGLTGGERYQSAQVSLGPTEVVTKLVHLEVSKPIPSLPSPLCY